MYMEMKTYMGARIYIVIAQGVGERGVQFMGWNKRAVEWVLRYEGIATAALQVNKGCRGKSQIRHGTMIAHSENTIKNIIYVLILHFLNPQLWYICIIGTLYMLHVTLRPATWAKYLSHHKQLQPAVKSALENVY